MARMYIMGVCKKGFQPPCTASIFVPFVFIQEIYCIILSRLVILSLSTPTASQQNKIILSMIAARGLESEASANSVADLP